MKRINGTITLSLVEEDNTQRVIFRVIPLCTREGIILQDVAETFPDHGSLRVVPDKREQSTFKERMREMGNLCVIELISSEGKELAKVRQNRNYAPDQGEYNQYAIYSDVIQEFACDSVFEVIEWNGQDKAQPVAALTRAVLFLFNKALYGPVPCEEIEHTDIAQLKPFGNDQFLLHTVELQDHTMHTVYWNPESTLNWRQRRSSLRRKGDKGQNQPVESESATANETAITSMSRDVAPKQIENSEVTARVAENPAVFSEEHAPVKASVEVAESETDFPIGTKLEILDTSISFEQQISLLDQPLAQNANRLAFDVDAPKEDSVEATARYSGTPFLRNAVQAPRNVSRPEPLHYVVEQQMRLNREGRPGADFSMEAARSLENPIENLLLAVDAAWQSTDVREQAISILLENRGFVESILSALQNRGQDMHAVAAAHAQLEDIEAERLRVLMQLDQAKESQKRYQEQAIAAVAQKKQGEINKLSREIESLSKEKEELLKTLREIGDCPTQVLDTLVKHLTVGGAICEGGSILLSPVIGHHYQGQEMLESVRNRLCTNGFAINTDEAMMLLIAFSLFPSICFQGESLAAAHLFATTFLDALGLQSVSATLQDRTGVQLASILPENEFRTPTVTIQRFGTEMMTSYGHKTFYLSEVGQSQSGSEVSSYLFPAIRIPAMKGALQEQKDSSVLPLAPAALSSFQELTCELCPLLEEGEKWFEELQSCFLANDIPLSDAMLHSMRCFVSISAQKIRGGFLAAADAAICLWIVPEILKRSADPKNVQSVLNALPRTLEALGIC